MFNEANLQWDKVNTYDNWYERSHETLGRQNYKWAYNRHDHHNPHTKQIGGTGIVARLAAHPRVVDKGEDTHRLGRWTWMKIEGRHQHFTKVLTAYRPHKNTSSLGTVYNQQLRYWREDQNNYTNALFNSLTPSWRSYYSHGFCWENTSLWVLMPMKMSEMVQSIK